MKVVTTQSDLDRGVSVADRAISSRTVNQLYQYMELQAKEDKLVLTGTDGDLIIKTEIDAEVDEHGTILLRAKPLKDLVSRMPEGDVRIDRDGNKVELTSAVNDLDYELQVVEDPNYPDIPPYSDKLVVELQTDTLRKALEHTTFATNKSDTSQQFTAGVYFNFDGDQLELVGTDSHRLAHYELSLTSPEPVEEKLLVPIAVASNLERLLPDVSSKPADDDAAEGSNTVEVYHQSNQVVFTFDGTWISSSLLDVKYPDYRRVIPSETESKVTVGREDLSSRLQRITAFSSHHSQTPVVTIETESEHLSMQTEAGEIGSGSESVPVDVEGEDIVVSFNPRYLQESLNVLETDEIRLHWRNPNHAMMLDTEEEPDFTYILMPMKMD